MERFLAVLFLIFSLNAFGVEPEAGKVFFTVQVASFKDISKARQVLEKVKDLPYARISYRNGRYKVRLGFFKSFSEAQKFVKEKLKGKVSDYYITKIKFSPEGVFFVNKQAVLKPKISAPQKNSTTNIKGSLSHEVREKASERGKVNNSEPKKEGLTVGKSDYQVMKKAQEELKKTETLINSDLSKEKKKKESRINKSNVTVEEKKEKNRTELGKRHVYFSNNKNKEVKNQAKEKSRKFLNKSSSPFLILSGIGLFLILVFIGLKRRKGTSPKDLEKLTAELFKGGRCEELLETVLPLLPSQPANTFLRKAVADCFIKQGKFLEAASLYEEIAEILDKKGLSVLSEDFKRKAEEVYGREFKRRG